MRWSRACWRSIRICFAVAMVVLSVGVVPAFAQQAPDTVTLAWDPNLPSENVTHYLASWRTALTAETFVPVPSGTQSTLTGLPLGQRVFFKVYAVNANGRSDGSNEVFKDLPAPPDTTAPSAPASLTGSAASSSQINLSWTASTDNVAVASYEVREHENHVAIVPGAQTSYSVTGLQPNTTHTYAVRALDAAGNLSIDSPNAVVTTLPAVQQKPCTLPNGQSYAITIQVLGWSNPIAPGGEGEVRYRLLNSFPITLVEVLLGTQVVDVIGPVGELRGVRSQVVRVPNTAGTYHLFVRATDKQGCVTTTSTIRTLVVQ